MHPDSPDIRLQFEASDRVCIHSAEDDRQAREELRAMPQEKLQSRGGDGDDEIDLQVRILLTQHARQALLVLLARGSREIEKLCVELNGRGHPCCQGLPNGLVEGEWYGRQRGGRIEQNDHLRVLRVGRGHQG